MNQLSGKKPKRGRKVLRILFFSLSALIVVFFGAFFWMDEAMPEGKEGPEADALAEKMQAAVNHEAWLNTGAVKWTFKNRHHFIWDRHRQYAKVEWKKYMVLLRIKEKTGLAFENGNQVEGEDADQLVNTAWQFWVNDAFWLNPIAKAFDPGTTRELVELKDGKQGVMVKYSSGGVTPGDSYLWLLNDDGTPYAWKMWVSIIPIGGLEFSWDDWITLPTGAKVSTFHKGSLLNVELTDIDAAATLAELVETDPFVDLEK